MDIKSSGCRHHSGRALLIPLPGCWPQCQLCETAPALCHANAHARTNSAVHTPFYLLFLYEHLCVISAVQWSYIPDRRRSQTDPETGSDSSLRLYSRLYLSARFSPTSLPPPTSLCHSTSTVAYFLQIHFLIGAAARRCCCSAAAARRSPKKRGAA